MFGNHGLCGLPEEGAHEKSPKCLGGNLGDFGGILQRSPVIRFFRRPSIYFLQPSGMAGFLPLHDR